MDIENLLAAGAPSDEYNSESIKISYIVDENSTVTEIAKVISEVFRRSFGRDSYDSESASNAFMETASKIKEEMGINY